MKKLECKQFLPLSLEEAWAYFSSPANLNEITPDDMSFEITSGNEHQFYEGMFITYKVAPLLGIKLNWVTEITKIKPGSFFIDEQRMGPYNIWHHEHHFVEKDGGVEMTDLLWYDVGMGPIGKLAEAVFVDQKVKSIFDYRYKKLEQLFGTSHKMDQSLVH
ncbi:MAG: SRPBCC family protein [Saprospiraceae bacterium]|nr:SRPBCC family protein [Saprospiraceae bacterium]